MSLARRSGAVAKFIDAPFGQNIWGFLMAYCQIGSVTMRRRKWARRWSGGTITTLDGTRIDLTMPTPKKGKK